VGASLSFYFSSSESNECWGVMKVVVPERKKFETFSCTWNSGCSTKAMSCGINSSKEFFFTHLVCILQWCYKST